MTQAISSQTSLCEQDLLRWLEEKAAQLKARDFEHLDMDHLVVEVEALGRSGTMGIEKSTSN